MKKILFTLVLMLSFLAIACGQEITVKINGENKVAVGAEITLSATTNSKEAVAWESTDPTIATVDENGKVAGVKAGSVTIKASAEGVVAAHTVEVYVEVESVTVTGENKVYIGETVTLTAAVAPSDANQAVTWSTSDAAVATVENGVVTGVAAGTVTITATAENGAAGQLEITVSEKVASLEPAQLKELLSGLAALYTASNTGSVKATVTSGEESFIETLKYSYTATEIVELAWEQQSKAASSIYIKGGKAYIKFEDTNGYQTLSENDYAAYKANYGVDAFFAAYLGFAQEDALYSALELVSFEENKNTYNLKVADYTGTEINTAGKESVKLVVEVVDGVILSVELTIVGETTTVLKVELGGTNAPAIEFPADLSSYPKL